MTSIFLDTFDLFTWKLCSGDIPAGVIASLDIGLIVNKEMSALYRYEMIFSSLWGDIVVVLCSGAELAGCWSCRPGLNASIVSITWPNKNWEQWLPSVPDPRTEHQPGLGQAGGVTSPQFYLLIILSLSGWLTIFFAVREIICGFVLNADPSHFGTVLWYFSFAKLDPRILWWDLVWEDWWPRRGQSGQWM